MIDLDSLDFEKGGGLVTVVAQDARSGAVLMVAHADREALERTVATGEMHYRSRTRGLWHKGATSGNVQRVVSLAADCDGDAVLARIAPAGPACHTGAVSCFGGAVPPGNVPGDVLGALDATIAGRLAWAAASAGGPPPLGNLRRRAPRSVTSPMRRRPNPCARATPRASSATETCGSRRSARRPRSS